MSPAIGIHSLSFSYGSVPTLSGIDLAEVSTGDVAKRRIGSLSGGQVQRALSTRALIGEPRILIQNEPTASIDRRLEGETFDIAHSH